ncbi:hypothetical protein CRYUN_Cryun12cG0144000 [Craigia yunnanensis]
MYKLFLGICGLSDLIVLGGQCSHVAVLSRDRFSYCDSAKDLQLQKRFQESNVSDIECASILKSILRSACNQFSAQLFEIYSGLRDVPVLCNSTVTTKSPHFSTGFSIDFCKKVWDICGNVSILNSSFVPSKQGRASIDLSSFPLKLTDQRRSRKNFCEAFGGPSDEGAVCFNGETVSFKNGEAPQHPEGLCLEKNENGVYLNLIPHPDGSLRVFLSNQKGKIWLENVPDVGSSEILGIVESQPFLDISDQVLFDTEFGLMGMAFHPNFANNGRFFLSLNCDKTKQQGCFARCLCNTDMNCGPQRLVLIMGSSHVSTIVLLQNSLSMLLHQNLPWQKEQIHWR